MVAGGEQANGPALLPAGRAILSLSLRALLSGRRWLLVAALDALFVAVALILALAAHDESPQRYLVDLTRTLALPILLPFIALIFASEALGSEVEERTLVYLTLRPLPGWLIVLAKYSACALVILAAIWLALLPAFFALDGLHGPAALLPALLIGAGAGALAYAALFLLLGLLLRRALLVGAIYILLWETAIAALSTGAAHLSVRVYALAVVRGVLGDDAFFPSDALTSLPSLLTALLWLAVVSALALWVTAWRLRRVEVK
jgi:ABC-2 type transport system permease protein